MGCIEKCVGSSGYIVWNGRKGSINEPLSFTFRILPLYLCLSLSFSLLQSKLVHSIMECDFSNAHPPTHTHRNAYPHLNRTINRRLHYSSANSASMQAAQHLYSVALMYMRGRARRAGRVTEWGWEMSEKGVSQQKRKRNTGPTLNTGGKKKREEIKIHHCRENPRAKTLLNIPTVCQPTTGIMTAWLVSSFYYHPTSPECSCHSFITCIPWIHIGLCGLPLERQKGDAGENEESCPSSAVKYVKGCSPWRCVLQRNWRQGWT